MNDIFKILSLGTFYQTLEDGITILNRPAIMLPNDKKKWGNEYILFNDKYSNHIIGSCFYGKFFQDKKKNQSYLRLFDIIEVPVAKPSYYVICRKHRGLKIDKWDDFEKVFEDSNSMLFSSAYHYLNEIDGYDCENIYLMKDGDAFYENEKRMIFNEAKQEIMIDTTITSANTGENI